MDKNINEELKKVCFLEELNSTYNKETVKAIVEAVEHPEKLKKLNTWEDLGI